jgi:hypothetical protein
VTIPIYVRHYQPPKSPAARFLARPLFAPAPERHGAVLSRVLAKLTGDLRKAVDGTAREAQQRELADWTFNPVAEREFLHLSIPLRRRTVRAGVLAVAFRSPDADRDADASVAAAVGTESAAAVGGGRQDERRAPRAARLGFFPELPDLWFDLPAGTTLAARAEAVLADHLRRLEREDEGFDPALLLGGEVRGALLTSVDVDVDVRPKLPKPPEPAMFALGSSAPADGLQELHRVGRSVDALYPDDLDHAVLREPEVADLARRLADPDRRPVLLLGPRGRRQDRARPRGRPPAPRGGQGPERPLQAVRLAAVAAAAGQRDVVRRPVGGPAAGDPEGGRQAGLRPVLRRPARAVRGRAAQPVDPERGRRDAAGRRAAGVPAAGRDDARGVPRPAGAGPGDGRSVRRAAGAGAGRARDPPDPGDRAAAARGPAPVPVRARRAAGGLDLQRRYVRDVAMPGKAAELLRRLAGGRANKDVGRTEVLAAFGAYSGLAAAFLDDRVRLRRADVVAALAGRVVSQPAAVDAMADAVCVAKARLNDPGRPVATFLFLGPTGVGKTESAKALAAYLFGAAGNNDGNRSSGDGAGGPGTGDGDGGDRLIRFDMNEFVDPAAAGRLTGTFGDPDGLLTAAVRRQPFGVVLLDEIEKAHPAVFDLLLAVLGEGRLTDARGRTADFTNAIVVMTSNLGAGDADAGFGLRPPGADAAAARGRYRAAAERFFRPEFFNRIDRVVPFDRLGRADVADIARRLMDGLLRRDGLANRRCVLRVDPAALARVVDAGYHPRLGARALKREVERQIAGPVARRLAAMPPGEPTVIDVLPPPAGTAHAASSPVASFAPPPRPAAAGGSSCG